MVPGHALAPVPPGVHVEEMAMWGFTENLMGLLIWVSALLLFFTVAAALADRIERWSRVRGWQERLF
jgi:hypothetical protein